jgi:hypothetical protein
MFNDDESLNVYNGHQEWQAHVRKIGRTKEDRIVCSAHRVGSTQAHILVAVAATRADEVGDLLREIGISGYGSAADFYIVGLADLKNL